MPPTPGAACRAGARSSLSYRSSLRHTHVSVKVQLPHERYADMAGRLPGLIERAMQQAVAEERGAAGLHHPQAAAGAAASAPRLLNYTHFQGCLTGVLEFESECALPPARVIEAKLQLLLPEWCSELVHLSVQEASRGSVIVGGGSSSSSSSSISDAVAAGGAWPWPDPVALSSNSAACRLDVVLHPLVLQQLPHGCGHQLRVVLAVAGGEVLSDGVVEVDVHADLASGGGAVKVHCQRCPPNRGGTDAASGSAAARGNACACVCVAPPGNPLLAHTAQGKGKACASAWRLRGTHRWLTEPDALQVLVPSHPGPLLLVHLLTAGEPGEKDRHIATLPLLVLPDAACEEVGLIEASKQLCVGEGGSSMGA
jgi:hypothetical protein